MAAPAATGETGPRPELATEVLPATTGVMGAKAKSPVVENAIPPATTPALPAMPDVTQLPEGNPAPPPILEPSVDPTLHETAVPPPLPAMTQLPAVPHNMPRAMLPFMHQLDVSVQGDYSAPASVTSSSPETPNTLNFGLYSNFGDKGSVDDLSRPQSMTDLSVYGATKGTLTSNSSESGVGEDHEEGGVPAPKPKKSHARKVCHPCCSSTRYRTDMSATGRPHQAGSKRLHPFQEAHHRLWLDPLYCRVEASKHLCRRELNRNKTWRQN